MGLFRSNRTPKPKGNSGGGLFANLLKRDPERKAARKANREQRRAARLARKGRWS